MIGSWVAIHVLLAVQGPVQPCTDGSVRSCVKAGCASGQAKQQCMTDSWTSCECVPTLAQCNDNNPCTTDSVSVTWCVNTQRTGALCDDGNTCTQGDTCSASGACTGTLVRGSACTNGDLCGGPGVCSADGSCMADAPASLTDASACTYDSCDASGIHHDPIAGACSSTTQAAENGGPPLVAGNPLAQPLPLGSTQGGPTVVENTGDVEYAYSFELPASRGRYAPTLGVSYSSAARVDEGIGHGWTLSRSYIETERGVMPRAASGTVSTTNYRFHLVEGSGRVALVDRGNGIMYAPEIVSGLVAITANPSDPNPLNPDEVPWTVSWTATDAVGNVYQYATYFGNVEGPGGRWYLTSVTDVDGNTTAFSYVRETGAAAVLAQVTYNRPAGGYPYATVVDLAYAVALPTRHPLVAGSSAQLKLRLQTVSVSAVSLSGTKKLVRRYELAYETSQSGPEALLRTITLAAGEGTALGRLPPTSFEYEVPGDAGYHLGVAPDASGNLVEVGPSTFLWASPSTPDNVTDWIDLDADGRVDRVEQATGGVVWYRNLTEFGASSIQFAAGSTIDGAALYGAETWYRVGSPPLVAVHAFVQDMNADGIPDFVNAWRIRRAGDSPTGAKTKAEAACALEVRFGQRDNGQMSYGTPLCFDLSAAFDAYQGAANAAMGTSGVVYPMPLSGGGAEMRDHNGDGLLDYWTNGAWYLGYRYDGIYPEQWAFAPAAAAYTKNTSDVFTSEVIGPDPIEALLYEEAGFSISCPPDDSRGFLVAAVLDPDPRKTKVYADLNGDGGADVVTRTSGGCSATQGGECWAVQWGATMGGRVRAANVDTGTKALPSHYPSVYPDRGVAQCNYQLYEIPDYSSVDYFTKTGTTNFVGWDAGFVDLNGDGVPEYVSSQVAGGTSWLAYRGHLRPALLRAVTTTSGARYDVEYELAAKYGAGPRDAASWVAKSVTLTGGWLSAATTYYWYSNPVSAPLWYEPVRFESRGFGRTWTLEMATKLARETVWATGSHVFKGSPRTVAIGPAAPLSAYDPAIPPTISAIRRSEFLYAARGPGGASCTDAAGEPPTSAGSPGSAYPAVPVVTSVTETAYATGAELTSRRTVQCSDVDDYGNVRRVAVDPDLSVGGDEFYEWTAFDGAATCKNCPVEAKVTSDAGGSSWVRRSVYRYDSPAGTWNQPISDMSAGTGHLNYVSRWVTSKYDAERYEVAAATAYNADGTVRFVVENPYPSAIATAVTTAYQYDAQQLRVLRTTVSDASVTLVRDATYDDLGRAVTQTGPYVSGAIAGPTVATAYDVFGRPLATGRSIVAPVLNQAIAAWEYVDTQPPTVKSYTFLAPLNITLGAVPVRSDVAQTITYLDELGRTLEVRERLGVGGSTDSRAQITQAVTGYRVRNAVIYDAAGRVVAAMEPVLSTTEALQGFDTLLANGPRKVTTVQFDGQGRTTCTRSGFFTKAGVDAALASGSCVSSLGDDTAHVEATAFRYSGERDTTGRTYVSVESIPPSTSATSGTRAYYRADGLLAFVEDAYRNTTWYDYDVLGQLRSSGRQLANGAVAAERARTVVSKTYDTVGRTVDETDDNWSPGTSPSRIFTYDALGRITRAQLPAQLLGGSRVRAELRYEYKSLGRVTRKSALEPAWSAAGISFATRELAGYKYDVAWGTPANTARYPNTAGRVSAVWSPLTTIALGYDQNGTVTLRDQWFTGLTGAFTASGAVSDDGRVLSSTFASSYWKTTTHYGRYDSRGRPVRIDAGTVTLWDAPLASTYGAYDAADRLATIKSNGGLVTTSRTYSPYTGRLTAHSVQAGATRLYGTDSLAYHGAGLKSFRDTVNATAYGFGYDANGRLVLASAAADPSAPVPAPSPALAQSYSSSYGFTDLSWSSNATLGNVERVTTGGTTVDYDYLGDRVVATRQGVSPSSSGSVLNTFVHDHAGRLYSIRSGTAEGEGFGYDVEDQLKQVRRAGSVSEVLEYDPTGAPLFRKVGTKAFWYVGSFATITADVAATCAGYGCAPTTTPSVGIHVNAGGARIATMRAASTLAEPTTNVLYYHRDRQGSVIATTLSNGVVGAKYRYGVYGQLERSEGVTTVTDSEIGYTGALRLGWTPGTQTGSLMLLGARVYHAELRRWLQPDTVDTMRYAYTGGDPANFVDPSGRMRISNMQRLDPEGAALLARAWSPGATFAAPVLGYHSRLSLGAMRAATESAIDSQMREWFGEETLAWYRYREASRIAAGRRLSTDELLGVPPSEATAGPATDTIVVFQRSDGDSILSELVTDASLRDAAAEQFLKRVFPRFLKYISADFGPDIMGAICATEMCEAGVRPDGLDGLKKCLEIAARGSEWRYIFGLGYGGWNPRTGAAPMSDKPYFDCGERCIELSRTPEFQKSCAP
jgi:RHS repeat-associated protein